jgi:hypothetical protein
MKVMKMAMEVSWLYVQESKVDTPTSKSCKTKICQKFALLRQSGMFTALGLSVKVLEPKQKVFPPKTNQVGSTLRPLENRK